MVSRPVCLGVKYQIFISVSMCDLFFVVCWCSLYIVLCHCHRVEAHSQLIINIKSDNYGFFDVGPLLWREDGSFVYNCCWPLPAQSFSGPSPTGHMTIFCCLRFEISSTWRSRPLYLYPQKQGDPVIPPGTGFPIRLLPRLAGLRWRYSTPPPPYNWTTLILISSRHGPRTENTALRLLHACLLGFPLDRYPDSLLARGCCLATVTARAT
jgi:hypothetical protein